MSLVALLVPPASLAPAAGLGLLAWRRRGGRLLAAISIAGLLLLSLPIVADWLLASLDPVAPVAEVAPTPQAIVVLGGDLVSDPGTVLGAQPGSLTLDRLREAAALQRRTRLPVLVSGGIVLRGAAPVAEVMAGSLRSDFGVPVRWVENRSANTWENARDSARLLRDSGIDSVLVVTSAWHERRAMIAFAQTGLRARPAPVRRNQYADVTFRNFLPQTGAWIKSYDALHEWIGCAWYSLRAWWLHG